MFQLHPHLQSAVLTEDGLNTWADDRLVSMPSSTIIAVCDSRLTFDISSRTTALFRNLRSPVSPERNVGTRAPVDSVISSTAGGEQPILNTICGRLPTGGIRRFRIYSDLLTKLKIVQSTGKGCRQMRARGLRHIYRVAGLECHIIPHLHRFADSQRINGTRTKVNIGPSPRDGRDSRTICPK